MSWSPYCLFSINTLKCLLMFIYITCTQLIRTMWLIICESVLVNKAIKTYQLRKEICNSHVNDLRQSYVKTLRSSPPEVFLGKDVLKTCCKFTGEHPCQNMVSIKLLCVVKQLYWDHTLVWMFSCKFTACFQNNFLREHFGRARIWKIPCQIFVSKSAWSGMDSEISLYKRWSFLFGSSDDLFTCTKQIFNGKLHFCALVLSLTHYQAYRNLYKYLNIDQLNKQDVFPLEGETISDLGGCGILNSETLQKMKIQWLRKVYFLANFLFFVDRATFVTKPEATTGDVL